MDLSLPALDGAGSASSDSAARLIITLSPQFLTLRSGFEREILLCLT